MPAVFALADKVIQQPQTATFAAFGSMAILVLVDFGGPRRTRLVAYLALAAVGAVLIVLGTVCSRNAWVAAVAMAVVGFAILFSGVINGYFAAAGTAAMLTFILPVTIRAPLSAIPARLEGWGLAVGAGICAVMLLWPARSRDRLRAAAARACLALADLVESELARDRSLIGERASIADAAVAELRRGFVATPYRPSGTTGRTAALASLVDELDWLQSFVAPSADWQHGLERALCREENGELMAAVVAVLRAGAARLDGRDERPDLDLDRLDRAREAVAHALARRISDLPPGADEPALQSALEPSFRLRAMSYAARQVGAYALLATGAGGPELDGADEPRSRQATAALGAALQASEQLAFEHASTRSVWFRNSVRGAAGVALAVLIAQRAGLQHAFWVVLGTLSVLRSNALGTGSTILSALAGTAVGILLGAALITGIGTSQPVLWALLPVAVLLAAYAPRAISFAAGQVGFTLVLFILFNLIQPTGWRVGIVRIEDVAIGFAISLGVGILFWPSGAAALLRASLAAAYARSADYVAVAAHRLAAGGDPSSVDSAAQAAAGAAHRLDDAFRQYLAEGSAAEGDVESLATLVAGATRLRRAGQSLTALERMTDGTPLLKPCADALDGEVQALRSWCITLGDALVNATPVPPPHLRDAEGRRRVLRCVREALSRGDETRIRPALGLLWASQHLDNLARLESHLAQAAAEGSS